MFQDARDLGMNVVVPEPNQVFIDLDCIHDQMVMEALLPIFNVNGFPLVIQKTTRSKNGGKHVYLAAPIDITPLQRVALQAILGSDRKREALGFLRVLSGDMESAFFEKKDSTPPPPYCLEVGLEDSVPF
jgi:hypothetical protein